MGTGWQGAPPPASVLVGPTVVPGPLVKPPPAPPVEPAPVPLVEPAPVPLVEPAPVPPLVVEPAPVPWLLVEPAPVPLLLPPPSLFSCVGVDEQAITVTASVAGTMSRPLKRVFISPLTLPQPPSARDAGA